MFGSFIDKARKKPKAARERIAIVAASSVTAVALLVWVLIAPSNLRSFAEIEDQQSSQPFESFMSQIKDQMAGVGEAIPKEEPKVQIAPTSTSVYTNIPTTTTSDFDREAAMDVKEIRIATTSPITSAR